MSTNNNRIKNLNVNRDGEKLPAYFIERFNHKDLNTSMTVLRALDEGGPMSQAQLAEYCEATQPFVALHLRRLLHEGMVHQKETRTPPRGGRPYHIWDIDRENNLTISISWKDLEIIMGLADFTGNLKISSNRDNREVTTHEQIYKIVDHFIEECVRLAGQANQHIRMCYVGMGGHIHPDTGESLENVSDPRINGINLEKHISERFGIKCMVHGGFARWYGEAQLAGDHTLTVISWSRGISISTGCKDQLFFYSDKPGNRWRGAWDLGHIVIVKNGRLCHCGKKGCLEAYTGGYAVIEMLERSDISNISELIAAGRRNDPQVLKILGDAAWCLGKNLTWHLQFMGVERIVLTGSLSTLFDKVRERFIAGLRTMIDDEWITQFDLRASYDPEKNLLSGACYMAQRMFFQMEYFDAMRRNSSEYYTKVVYPQRKRLLAHDTG